MKDPKTISFVGTKQIEMLLKQWAAADDRSVSYVIRQILEAAAKKRAVEEQKKRQTA